MNHKFRSISMVSAFLFVAALLTPMTAEAATSPTTISSVSSNGCVLLSDGNVDCFQNGTAGASQNVAAVSGSCQIKKTQDIECYDDSIVSFKPLPELKAISISADGTGSGCAALVDGSVDCWFWNLGNPDISVVSGISNAVQVSATVMGGIRGCALLSDATVKCWGNYLTPNNSAAPVNIDELSALNVTSISVSGNSACAVIDDGTVWCWGENASGQLGRTATGGLGQNYAYSGPLKVEGISDVKTVTVGASGDIIGEEWNLATTTCALTNSGSVYCWGYDRYREGYSDSLPPLSASRSTPQLLRNLNSSTVKFFYFLDYTRQAPCAVMSDESVACWTAINWSGGESCDLWLAVSTCSDATLRFNVGMLKDPPFVPTLDSATTNADGSISATWSQSTDLNSPSTDGYLVRGVATGSNLAISSVFGGGDNSMCGILSDTSVACWGNDTDFTNSVTGSLFGGKGMIHSAIPVLVNGLQNATQLAVGSGAACALLRDQTVSCWGSNGRGELGIGVRDSQGTVYGVTPLNSLSSVTQIAGDGYSKFCAISTGKVYCWGGSPTGGTISPVEVPLITNAKQVSLGWASACALITDGTVRCWGVNTGTHLEFNVDGMLGDGTTVDSLTTPTTVVGLSDAISIAASAGSVCALEADGTVVCWGGNINGELGTQNLVGNAYSTLPVIVPGIPKAVSLSALQYGTCALDVAGTPYCWGWPVGFLNGGPTAVTSLAPALNIAGSLNNICSTTKCIGSNMHGVRGNGTYESENFDSPATSFTKQLVATCYTGAETSCTLPSIPGAETVTVSVQALHGSDLSISSNSITLDVAGKTSAITQFDSTSLGAQVGSTLTLSATSTDQTATVSYSTSTPNCSLSGGNLTASSAALCEVTASSTAVSPAAKITPTGVPAPKAAAPGSKSVSSTLHILFTKPNQSTLSVANSTTNLSVASVTLQSAGGSGGGKVSFYSNSSGCTIQGSTLFAVSDVSCMVWAKKAADLNYAAAISASKTFTFAGLGSQSALTLSAIQPTSGALTLASSGGTGTGATNYYSPTAGCSITAGVLSVQSPTACAVTAIKAGDSTHYSQVSSPVVYKFPALTSSITSTFKAGTATATGFSLSVANYNAAYAYTVRSNVGTATKGTVSGTTLPITVSGLVAGQYAVVTVTTSRSGYYDKASTSIGNATPPSITLATPSATNGGFTVGLSKLSTNYTYSGSVAGGTGSVSISTPVAGSATATVTGVTSSSSILKISATPISTDALNGGYAAPAVQTITGWSKPTISSLQNSSGSLANLLLGNVLTINGANLWGATAVTIGTVKATSFTVLSPTSISVGVWSGAKPGAVAVTTPGGTVSFGTVTVKTTKSVPASVTLTPTSGGAGTAIVLDGSDVGSASAITVGGVTAKFKVVSATRVVISVPTITTNGAKAIKITTPGGSVTAAATFTYGAKVAPGTVSSVSSSVDAGSFVTLTGTNLGAATSITIGGTSVTNWTVNAGNSITLQIPPAAVSGTSPAMVFTTAGGTVNFSGILIN